MRYINIPEKWYVVRTKENHEKLNKWENDRSGDEDGAYLEGEAYFFPDKDYSSNTKNKEGYIEITWEEFERYILNKEQTYEIY